MYPFKVTNVPCDCLDCPTVLVEEAEVCGVLFNSREMIGLRRVYLANRQRCCILCLSCAVNVAGAGGSRPDSAHKMGSVT